MKGFLLSGGNVQDAQAGRLLLETLGKQDSTRSLLIDRAYADYSTRLTVRELRFNPAVPPKKNLKHPWEYDRGYKRRIERFFRRLKGFRGIFTRYDKLDRMFTAFIYPAVICIACCCVNTP